MFERDIKFISDFCINQIRELGTSFTYEKLATLELHPAILKYVSAELDFMIYADRRKLLQNSYFDYSGKEISLYFKKMAEEVKKTKRISIEDIKKLILQAVSFNANYVVRPKWSLTKLVYNDQKSIPVEELEMMLNYIYYYDYINNVLSSYLAKRKAVQMNLTEFDLILNKIERELLKANTEQLVNNSLNSIADFFNIGGVSKSRVSPAAVEMLLREKNLTDHLLRLRSAIPETAKKTYEINDIKSVIYSTVPVQPNSIQGFDEEKKTIEKVETPVETSEDSETKEDEKESESVQGSEADSDSAVDEEILKNELESAELKIPDSSLEQIDEELKKDLEEIVRLEEQLEEEDNQGSFEEIFNKEMEETSARQDEPESQETSEAEAEIKEESEISSEPERISPTNGEAVIEESIEEKEEENVSPVEDELNQIESELNREIVEENSEMDLTDEQQEEKIEQDYKTEKEIISEMLQDHFGDDQVSNTEDQKEEADKLEEELIEKQSEVENDENIVENETEITEEEKTIEKVAEEESLVTDYVKTPEEELMDMFEDLEIIERGKADFTDIASTEEETPGELNVEEEVQYDDLSEMDQVEHDLRTIDEIAFSDDEVEIVTEEKQASKEPEHKEPPQNNYQPSAPVQKREVPRTESKPSPRSLRKKDLLSYLKGKEIRKIISNVFNGDEVDFVTSTEKIMECGSYRESTDIIKGIFLSYKINPYSKEALILTNAVSNYFRQA